MGQINIEVTHLYFSYEKQNPILQDISFTADGQASIGVVGANGVAGDSANGGVLPVGKCLQSFFSLR